MNRRELIAVVSGAGGVLKGDWPLGLEAQEKIGVRRIGVLMSLSEDDPQGRVWITAFRVGLAKLGWVEGRNLRIDYRWVALDAERTQRFAKELVALQPDAILSSSTFTTAALLKETRIIPIVFGNIVDPIGSGFVASLPRPGGNATGFTNLEPTMVGKWLGLLKELAPRVTRVAAVYNPTTAPYAEIYLRDFRVGAASFGMEPIVAPVRDTSEIEAAIITGAERRHDSGLFVVPDPFNLLHRADITSLAARNGLPAIYSSRDFVSIGGLLSYGNDIADNYRRASGYVDRMLKGEKPSDRPVQFPVKFELVLNLKTANTLGLIVPSTLLARADDVLE